MRTMSLYDRLRWLLGERAPDGPDMDPSGVHVVRRAGTRTGHGESTDSTPVTDIEGIGPTYGARLASAGIDDVAALAAANPRTIAERTDIAEARLERWVRRARERN
ncbi:MAG: helix-hairpin-helix domain-containing protein [Halobacteriaceae archaeon]